LFNEKVMAGLGRGVDSENGLDLAAMAEALNVLARFKQLASLMGIDAPHTVATAAVRQASNGASFLRQIEELGLRVSLLSGDEEAEAAGLGVITGFPAADGIVGDLGGGSLELVRISGGSVHQRVSFPLGVLLIAAIRAEGPKALERHLKKLIKASGWSPIDMGLPLYLVGGSWRSLAKIHMSLTRYPLPILHSYTMPTQAAVRVARAVARMERAPSPQRIVSAARWPAMGDAAALLVAVVNQLKPSALIVSATGLREGLVYRQLPREQKMLDPLIIAARAEGRRQGRFSEHGDRLNTWLTPLFEDEEAADRRLLHAACLLGDIGWAANPDFRAERALEFALHGSWYGLDVRGRAMIAHALFVAFGGGPARPPILDQLASGDDLDQARRWGLAIRLGQRLSGGVEEPLAMSYFEISPNRITLTLSPEIAALQGDTVTRRMKQLASAIGAPGRVRVLPPVT
jgi:exopolyphosphatase / guanosine-5'-triphosphate,3'-diphosphate pyrophosphatase